MARLARAVALSVPIVLLSSWTLAQEGPGLAANYPNDEGLADDPAVLYFLDFDDEAETMAWANGTEGYGWTADPAHVYSGGGALEIQQTTGTHDPYEIHPEITETDVAYVRWYRKWQPGYDFTQHKMSGVYAKAPGASGAGEIPTGYDKYSCKLFVDFDRYPRFYTYHPEQDGIYGDAPHMNLVDPAIQVADDRWYCFEMMIKANTVGQHDGELKMWIDGQLVGHIEGMRFRDTDELKINEFTYSAYVGGSWTSEQDQNLWDDQIVVATEYIGPLWDGTGGGPSSSSGSSSTSTSGSSSGTGGSGGSDNDGTPKYRMEDDSCDCRSVGRGGRGSAGWLLLAALGASCLGRRRRP